MHTIQPGSKVLVTGANGYISVWLIKTLLEQGYEVRGTVRSLKRSSFLEEMFKSYGGKFKIVAVEDITQDGAFDEVVKDVAAILHLASPVTDSEDPKDIIDPAIKGTTGILQSALHHAPGCKRIIVVSSIVAAFRETDEPIKISGEDWNNDVIEKVKEKGQHATGFDKYAASKTHAELAAWEFYNNPSHKAQVKWDMVFIHPAYVFGPTLRPLSSPSELNLSLKFWYDAVVDQESSQKTLMDSSKAWVDVRDLAKAIAKALAVEDAGGNRILVLAGTAIWQDWLDVVNSLSPSPIPSHAPGTDKALAKGSADGKNARHLIDYDTSIAQKILAPEYMSMEESARDMLADFERRGW